MILKGVFHWVLNYWHRLVSLGNVPIHCNRETMDMFVCVHVYMCMYVSECVRVCVVCMIGYCSLLIIAAAAYLA